MCLKEVSKFIRNGKLLETGRPINNFGRHLPRELLGNCLLCMAVNFQKGSYDLIPCSDPNGSDGIIHDQRTGKSWWTEHTFVSSRIDPNKLESSVISAIEKKIAKGKAYASNKILVVFLNARGIWRPNKIGRLIKKNDFSEIWVIGLSKIRNGIHYYNIFNLRQRFSPGWRVKFGVDFRGWKVARIQ